jgi:hypothetical protein
MFMDRLATSISQAVLIQSTFLKIAFRGGGCRTLRSTVAATLAEWALDNS